MPSLHFKGKQLVQNHHLVVPHCQLMPNKKASLTEKISLHDNLILHGDNLKALKALLPTHQGKIKCIYIDPPYNTGNEGWVYNDNVNDPMLKEWFGKVVDKEDLTRHDKWLCMMWPRLKLLKELLKQDGAIFVSCDDNELSNLVSMMNEIFDAHHVGTIPVVNNMKGRNDKQNYAQCHEYVVIFDKGYFVSNGLPLSDKQKKEFKYTDNGGEKYALRDLRKRGGNDTREARENLYFPIFYDKIKKKISLRRMTSNDVEIIPTKKDGTDGCWRWGKKKVEENLMILEASYVARNDKWNISYRVHLNKDVSSGAGIASDDIEDDDDWDEEIGEPYERSTKSKSFWWGPEFSTDGAGKLLKLILGSSGEAFDYPKPVSLIKRIIYMTVEPHDIILDSFAGSGTTAHAVLALNKEDGGNRKFILIETLDYADTVTAERVRRVIKGVPKARDEALKQGLGGSFSYFELGKPIEMQSILNGKNLPTYQELASYIFFTATGEEWNGKQLDAKKSYIGESRNYHVYLFYRPDVAYLKNTALTLDSAGALPLWKTGDKRRLVFAPTKYLDQDFLDRFGIDFARLPYEIYQLADSSRKKAGA